MDSKLQLIELKLGSLKSEYDDFVALWREIATTQAPTRGRFLNEKRKQGDKKYARILNNTAGRALRDATSGIFAGTASPSTKWFTLETFNPELMRLDAVRRWVFSAEETVRAVLRDSNFYSEYPNTISELLLFGTAALTQVPSFDSITRFYTHTIGTYYIGVNNEGVVDTIALIRKMTARQMAQQFGKEKIPAQLRTEQSQTAKTTYEVIQFIEPNEQYDPKKLESKYKKFASTWFVRGYPEAEAVLRESGFDKFPTYVPRWSVADEYAFGVDCPGMVALSDVNSLQQRERDKAKAIDRHIRPKLKGPSILAGMKLNDKDGDLIAYDNENSREGLSPIYQVDPRINEMRQDIQAYENAVLQAYFVDLFRAISSMQGVQPRNQLELSQRNAEALLLLGPVLERVQRELLSNVLTTTFAMCLEAKLFPEMPPELENGALNIRFISSLAQAQRSQDLAALGDYTQFALSVGQALPYTADKTDGDALLDMYVNLRGVNPMVARDQKQVGEMRQAQAQQAQQSQQLQAEQQMASANVQNATAEKARSEINA